MNKILLLFAVLFTIISCDSKNSYTINGTVADERINGKAIYLYDYATNLNIDTTIVSDGKFTFKGTFESPTYLRIEESAELYYANILTENNDIYVELSDESIVTSDGINGELIKMEQQISDARQIMKDSLSKIYKNKEELNKAVGINYVKFFRATYNSYAEANRDNMLGNYCVNQLIRRRTLSEADSLLNKFPLAKNYPPIMRMYNDIKIADNTSPGKPFIDFSGKNVDGTPAKLSDYVGKGKYVLVDFWASWCGPCTAENPNLKYLHENYPDLIVLGINVWESKEEDFHKYIKDKNIKWSMLYASHDNTAMELYGIAGIPTIILFDTQGIVVDKTLRGEKMKEKIAEIFNK